MAEFIETEEKVIDIDEPVIFENKTDSDFEVSAGIVFRKSGLYDVSIVGRRTIISKVAESQPSDSISRQAAIDAKQEFRNPNVVRSTEARTAYDRAYANGWNDCNSAWIDVVKDLPSAQPENNKQELIRAMNAGIIVTDAKDVYSCGFRNGIRWCRALLEDGPSTLNFEDASQYEQPEIVRCKECKFYTETRTDLKTGICSLACRHLGDDGFCSEAIRREG